MLSLDPRWPQFVPRSDSNPIQAESNPVQSNPIRSKPIQDRSNPTQIHIRIGPWPLQVGSGWSHQVGNHRNPSEIIRNHPKPSGRKPFGLSIGQSKCVVLLYLSIYLSIYLLTFPIRRLHTRVIPLEVSQFQLQVIRSELSVPKL